MDPLEILPPEMWEEIFGRIKGAEDWLNLYRASPSFQSVVGPRLHEALFPQVLPLLTKYLTTGNQQKHLMLRKLLPLRLVSHKWKQGVESLIESKVSSDEVTPDQLNYHFSDPRKISKLLEKFENHETSPFIGSTVLLRRDDDTCPPNTHNMILRLMLKFGRHLKGLIIEHRMEPKTILDQVRDVLQLVPVLERLKIRGHRGPPPPRSNFYRLAALQLRSEEDMRPLPALSNLKSIVIQTRDSEDGEAFANALLRTCSGARNSLSQATVEWVPNELIHFPNLKSVLVRSRSTTEGLSRLERSKWPLTALSLVWSADSLESVALQLVFRTVNHFHETLASLSLAVLFGSRESECFEVDPPLVLPRLKTLRISGTIREKSLDFLEHLSELQELRLEGWSEREYKRRNETRKIKIPLGGTNKMNMLESNIWKVVPSLRKFYFGGELLLERPTAHWTTFRHVYWRGGGDGQLRFKSL